jgi:epoxyqueuosine reductase
MSKGKKLLLHVCCAPCSTHVIESLGERFEITCYFYNPNIWPLGEYRLRLNEARQLCRMSNVPMLIGPYDSALWMKATRGLEEEPEGGRRCEICYRFRLSNAADTAASHCFDLFATTLTISPHKRAAAVNKAGKMAAHAAGTAFLAADFKKGGGFLRSIELSKKHDLYRQRYCGCGYSMRDADEE